MLAATVRPSVLQLGWQVCLQAYRAVAQSAGRDVLPAVRVPAVDRVQLAQRPGPLVLRSVLVLGLVPLRREASPKDVRQAALEVGQVQAQALHSVPVSARLREALPGAHSVRTQAHAAASHRAHPAQQVPR